MNSKEIFEIVHREIQHEHNLISSRMSWYVTSQSFLMAAMSYSTASQPHIRTDHNYRIARIEILLNLKRKFLSTGIIGFEHSFDDSFSSSVSFSLRKAFIPNPFQVRGANLTKGSIILLSERSIQFLDNFKVSHGRMFLKERSHCVCCASELTASFGNYPNQVSL